jgi:hypothetical protein
VRDQLRPDGIREIHEALNVRARPREAPSVFGRCRSGSVHISSGDVRSYDQYSSVVALREKIMVDSQEALIVIGSTLVLLHTFYCIARILRRIGFSGWWVLSIGFWPIVIPLLAYIRWPIEQRGAAR